MTVSENGKTYMAYWWTQGSDPATNNGGSGSGFPWFIVTTNPAIPVPSVPANLTAAGASNTSVLLKWDASWVALGGSLTGYAVFQNGKQIATTTVPFYTATGLTPHTSYNFTVDAIDVAGASPQSTNLAATTAPTGNNTTAVYAPYIDMCIASDDNLVAISQASGIKTFTLAFIQSSGMNSIAWAGTGSSSITNDVLPNGTTMLSQIQALRAAGGNVIISFGGAAGTDPAMAFGSAQALQAAYQSVIDRYHVSSLDFDIEGTPETDQASITMRDQALVGLKAANPGLTISFTLPVTPTGLDAKGLNVVTSAKADGLTPDIVDLMTADYNSQIDQGGAMGLDAIDAAISTETQLRSLGIGSKIGLTPMIGLNDVTSEIFTTADAQKVVDFVKSDPSIGRLSMWSVARDNGNGAGATYVSNENSSISQAPYAFSKIFENA
jgi:chitodextrinase